MGKNSYLKLTKCLENMKIDLTYDFVRFELIIFNNFKNFSFSQGVFFYKNQEFEHNRIA